MMNDGQLWTGGTLTFVAGSGGTFDMNGHVMTVASLNSTVTNNGVLMNNATNTTGTLTYGGGTFNATARDGLGKLALVATGSATLGGTNLFTGGLTVNGRRSTISNSVSTNLPITVASGAFLNRAGRSRFVAAPPVDGLVDEQAFSNFLPGFKEGPARSQPEQNKPAVGPDGPAVPSPEGASKPRPDALKPFFSSVPEQLLAMWNLLRAVEREPLAAERQGVLGHLAKQLSSLKYAASIPELLPIWQVTSVTEGLVLQLAQRAGEVTTQRLQCVDLGLGLLADLCQPGLASELSTVPAIRLLAVDDDLITRQAVASSLRKAFKQPDLAANGEAALAQISTIEYDVIFLDILMPGLDGFELLSRIRQTSPNRLTPVVFVTSQTDLATRQRSGLCGADGLITKPFLAFEITLTALVLALRARLRKRRLQSCPGSADLTPAISSTVQPQPV